MALYRKHIFICTSGPYCWYDCDQGDPDGFLKYLKRRVAEAGLRDAVRVNRSGCLNQCGHGPTLVVYPEGVWYGGCSTQIWKRFSRSISSMIDL